MGEKKGEKGSETEKGDCKREEGRTGGDRRMQRRGKEGKWRKKGGGRKGWCREGWDGGEKRRRGRKEGAGMGWGRKAGSFVSLISAI